MKPVQFGYRGATYEVIVFRIHVQRTVLKPIAEVFEALADHASYARFAGVESASLVEEGTDERNGAGALRRVDLGGVVFHERITAFERPTRMDYIIERSKPLPMDHHGGQIVLEATSDTETLVTWTSTGHVAIPLLGRLVDKLMQRQGSRAFAGTLKTIGRE
ncbi:MAG: hypothetical protein ACJATT_002896 [Myxococcota bacterium]|jgi:uncharacterized protein YndB with AHSA1/START domain